MRGTHTRVYPFREDSALLLPFAQRATGTLLEVGCGEGRAALEAARAGATTVASDVNPLALLALRDRARALGLRISIVRADLLEGFQRFDRILANPPYLPTDPGDRDPDPWVNRALDGGPDGCLVTRRLIASALEHLTEGGAMFLVVSSLQDPDLLARSWDGFERMGGRRRRVSERTLEGERLEVWELRPRVGDQATRPAWSTTASRNR